MDTVNRTATGLALSNLILDLFRLNNRLLVAGDQLVADVGLTSARWKVLGTIAAAERPQPVAWLARDMGGNRQNVQRIVNDLMNDGLVVFQPNPHHRTAQLVVMTEAGMKAYNQAMSVQAPWVDGLADGLTHADLQATHRVIATLCRKLESQKDA